MIAKATDWLRERAKLFHVPRGTPKRSGEVVAHGAPPLLWCVLLTLVGVAALVGSTWMLVVFVAGSVGHVDWASSYRATEAGVTENRWHFEASIHWLVGVGLFLFCAAIAIFNASWLEARKHMMGLVKHFVTGIGVLVALFMISGAIVVQQRGTDARERDRAVAVGAAQVGASSATGRLQAAKDELATLMNHENTYMAVAASVGAEEFERSYLSAAALEGETPARVNLLRRSLGAARRADTLRATIADLEGQAQSAQVTAVAAAAPVAASTGWTAALTRNLEDARKPVTATLGELLAMTAFGFALASWRARRAAMEMMQGEAITDRAHLIPDFRDEDHPRHDAGPVQPLEPIKTGIFDGETGEELERISPKPYLRRKRGKAFQAQPERLPDEVGVSTDGGARTGLSAEQIAAQMQPGNVLAGAVDRPVLDGALEQQQANADSAQDHDVRDHMGLHDDGGRKAEEQAASEDNADSHNGIARDALQTIHTPDSTPASPEQEAPIFSADEMSAFDEAPLGLGEDGRDGVVVRERELEGAK